MILNQQEGILNQNYDFQNQVLVGNPVLGLYYLGTPLSPLDMYYLSF